MKMSIRQMTRGAAVLALVLANTGLNWAQEVPTAVTPLRPVRQEASPGDTLRFDLDFPGGTVGEFVKAVGKARGTPINVVIPEDLMMVTVPEMRMANVDAASLLEAASSALLRPVMHPDRSLGRGLVAVSELRQEGYNFQPVARGVWTFKQIGGPPPEIPISQSVVFFSLEPYLDRYSIDDIITVIEAGNQLRPDSKPLSLKFHKETKLLVVRGTSEDLDMVKGALIELRSSEKPGGPAVSSPTAPAQPK